MTSDLLITGSIAIDTIETPFESKENVLGGSVTYALWSASRFADCHIVGIVGDDFPQSGWDLYQTLGKDLTDLQVKQGSTFRWGGKYLPNWNDRETLFTDLGVFENFVPTIHENNQAIQTVLLANIHPDLQLKVMNQSRADVFIVDTMNLWINITRPALENVLKRTHVLLVNESEAEQLSGFSDPLSAANELRMLGINTVIVKLGSKGALAVSAAETVSVKAFPVDNVVDPTGAGDVFAGAVAGILANGGELRDALVHASALASVCVEGFGIEALQRVTKGEITRRIAWLDSTVNL